MKEKSENDYLVKNKTDTPYTILVVEDNMDMLGLIEKKLEQARFQTVGVLEGAEAIAWLADYDAPVLMLLDYRLLDMTGKEVIKTLNEQQRSVPFIIITGQNDARIAVEMMKLGARDYLVKGIGFMELLIPVIHQVLEQLATEKRLAEAEEDLRESEAHFRALFENSPVSLWEEDFSAVKVCLDELRVSGATNLRAYFEQVPESVVECVKLVKVIDVNKAALNLYEAESKEELLGSLETILRKERLKTFREELLTLAAGDTTFEQKTILKTTSGDKKHVVVKLFIPPGYEETWSRVLISIVDITKHKQAEEKIRRQNEFLNSAIESLAHPFYVINTHDYTLEMANSAAARSFDMATTKTCYALAHQQDKPCDGLEHPCPLEEVKKTKKPAIMEHIHFDKEGKPRNVEVHGYPIFNQEGNVIQMIEYTLDITKRKQAEEELKKYHDRLEELVEERTIELAAANEQLHREIAERKQAEKALRESEERFRQVINSISDHIYVTEVAKDGSLANRYLSPHVEVLTGYPYEKFAADWNFWPSTVIHSDDRAAAAVQLNQLVTGQNSEVEYRLSRADDKIIWVRDSARVHSRGDSKVIYGLVSNISERKLLEERLTAIHQLGQELILLHDEAAIVQRVLKTAGALRFENTGWGLVDKTAGELRYCCYLTNDKLEEIDLCLPLSGTKGIGVAAIRSSRIINVSDTNQDSRYVPLLQNQRHRSVLCVPVAVGQRAIGVLNVGCVEPNYFTDNDQQLLQTLADQTAAVLENARLYQAEREQYHRLQQSQDQLIQVEKMAALGRLVASLAHEINNPLQAVDSCLTLVEEELAGSPYQQELGEYLAMAVEEVERVSTIVRRMRDFYRPAHQKQPLQTANSGLIGNFYRPVLGELQMIDLHAVLGSVLLLANKQLQNHNITVECAWANELPLIQGRTDYFKQLFLNLVLNAIDAMAAQGGVLRISTGPDQIKTSKNQLLPAVCLEFSDTGAGISPEILPRLFEPLFTTKEQGSGFGLFTSYKIVEAQNGQITVTSQEGEGTTFTILLPVTQPD